MPTTCRRQPSRVPAIPSRGGGRRAPVPGLKRISAPQAHSLQGNQEDHWQSLVPSSRWKGIPRHAIRISASLARSVCHPTNQDGRRPSDTLDMCGISLLAHPCLARSWSEKAGRRAMPSYRFHGLGCDGVTALTHANSDPIGACTGRLVVPDRLLRPPGVLGVDPALKHSTQRSRDGCRRAGAQVTVG